MQRKIDNKNGYRTHDISRLMSSYEGNPADYIEITEEELIKITINKYPLFRDINNSNNKKITKWFLNRCH